MLIIYYKNEIQGCCRMSINTGLEIYHASIPGHPEVPGKAEGRFLTNAEVEQILDSLHGSDSIDGRVASVPDGEGSVSSQAWYLSKNTIM